MSALGGKRTLAFILRGRPVSVAPRFSIRLVDRLKQADEAGSFVDRPCTAETFAK
jgi:hypothetical protein